MMVSMRSIAVSMVLLLMVFCSVFYAYTKKRPQAEGIARLSVRSNAFVDGGTIPILYTGQGADHSPQLSWKGAPAGTESFVIIVDDPDAPAGTWVHWVVFNIPGTVYAVAENAKIPGAIEGKNSWSQGRTIGYRGPLPPKGGGQHHYRFRVYALDTHLNLPSGATKDEVGNASKGHILAQGTLVGLYEYR